ncbi:HotDog domain-containing protein [Sporodiniella umbellata]|nr:HotDog domain-containing protein [Sporodiniella umbellata]
MFTGQAKSFIKKASTLQIKNRPALQSFHASLKRQNKHGAFTVYPTAFWADKILERECKRPVVSSKPRFYVEKTMENSYVEDYLPFKSDPELLDQYIFSNGKIRTGKLLEDLDALAGAIAYKHIDNHDPDASPVTVVTASVDRFDLFLPEAGIENYKFTGHVTHVGSSSMEVFIKAETCGDELPEPTKKTPNTLCTIGKNTVLATRFTMVAIDSATQKPIKVNPLRLESTAEERLFDIGEATKQRKKREKETSLTRQPPTPAERLDIHDVFLEYSKYTSDTSDERQPLPEDKVWMSDTKLESNFLMQPQDRNIHNNIFGGYLMRRAYELAYANTAMFMKSSSPVLLSMDEVAFRKPVHVGTLLNLKSNIIYSEGFPHRTVQVRVVADVVSIEEDLREATNVFYFTLITGSSDVRLRRILPRTYAESMLWINAKRRRQQGIYSRHALLESMKDN